MKHNDALMLLPWFANETLSASETRALAKHLQSCEECSAELAEVEQFRMTVAEVPASEPQFDPSCLDSTFARLEHVPQLAPVTAEPTLGWAARLGQWWSGQWQQMPSLGKVAMTAQLALVLGLVAVGAQQDSGIAARGEGYETVAGPGTGVNGGPAAGHFTLVFTPDASEQAMRKLLLEVDAQVIAGPNPMGMYTINIGVAQQRNAAASKLRASPLVLYIEAAVAP